MLSALRSSRLKISSPSSVLAQSCKLGSSMPNRSLSSSPNTNDNNVLDLKEVESVLKDVRADDVRVIAVGNHCDWADYMVLATGRSTWHVKNIAQALIYKVKQKQRGAQRMMLPSVQGQREGKWVVIDSGKVIVHALEEKARAYYNLETIWASDTSRDEPVEDVGKAFIKIRPKNNSKKRVQKSA